jgi:hypothetical protein
VPPQVHDHFDGSAHCVECEARCKLAGFDLGLTQFVPWTLEALAYNGFSHLPSRHREALEAMRLDADRLWNRAVITTPVPRRS